MTNKLERLCERAAHGTHLEDLREAFDLGVAACQPYLQHRPECEITKEREANRGNWCATIFSSCTCGLAATVAK